LVRRGQVILAAIGGAMLMVLAARFIFRRAAHPAERTDRRRRMNQMMEELVQIVS